MDTGAAVNVSILLVRGVLSELRGRGLDERRALAGTGIDEARLADLSAVVSVSEWAQIVAQAQELSGEPALSVAASQHFPLSALHWLNHLMRAASTLRGAIEIFCRYQSLIAEPVAWRLHEQGEDARFVCSSILHGEASQFAVDFMIGVALRTGERLSPRRSGGKVRVELAIKAPSHAADYAAGFGSVSFGARENAIVFPRVLLDESREALVDSPLVEPVKDYAEHLLAAYAQRSLSQRVRTLLSHEGDLSQFEAARMASTLGLSERTLRRRLAEEGLPLAELLGEVRRKVAVREMQEPNVAIKELSERLGFSEPSAFHRAFKRWTGHTPSEYIKLHAARRSRMRLQPGDDSCAESSGIFQVHEVANAKQLLDHHA